MLFTGGGTFLSNEFPTTGNAKPLTTVIPFVESNFLIPTGVSNITAQVWGGGGASGSCYFGTSGAGGGGGYVSASIPVSDLGITALTIRSGGGGGNPTYYTIPSDEYTAQNTSTIEFVGGESASSAPTYNTIALRGTSSSSSSLSVSTITFVGSVSGTTVTSLTLPATQEGDIVIIASAADQNAVIIPTGYTFINLDATAASYTLSYKVMGAVPDTEITGLQDTNGTGAGVRNVAHLAMVFRGVSATNPIIETAAPINNAPISTNILLPDVTVDSVGCMSVAFGFLDDVGANVTASPTGYSPSISQIADAIDPANPNNDEVTIMSAFRLLTASGLENPDQFTVDNNDNYSSFTLALRPQKTITPPSSTLPLPTNTQVGDFLLVASVADGSTLPLNLPSAFDGITTTPYANISNANATNTASYRLSWRRVSSLAETITNLSTEGIIDSGLTGIANGEPAGVAHFAMSFSNVDTLNPFISAVSSATGNPDPPATTNLNIGGYMAVAFGFLDNVSQIPSTLPTGYVSGGDIRVGTDANGANEASIMTAYRIRPNTGIENPASFTVSGTNPYTAITVALRPSLQSSGALTQLPLPLGSAAGDIVFCSSVADGGTLNPPPGFIGISSSVGNDNVSYQLSYKILAAGETLITGLTPAGAIDGGAGDGDPAGVAHACLVFRGFDPASPPTSTIATGTGNPDPPNITGLLAGDTAIALGFLDNVSITPTGVPANFISAVNVRVGTDNNGNNEASFMSAYRLTIPGTSENPTTFNVGGGGEPWTAITIGLRAARSQKFSIITGGCGGSGGGYSGIFYNLGGILTPLLIAGGGGGGGGASINATTSGGVGGAGGGGAGGPGFSGLGGLNSGPGGGGGTLISGGAGGFNLGSGLNPGEAGFFWDTAEVSGFLTGGRGANSPVADTTSVPLYGANATGGWIRGSGGGSSRNLDPYITSPIPTDCGGAGGAGYYGGGGGGAGNNAGGGGGGGGSNYINPLVSALDNFVAIGTSPGVVYDGIIGYGGNSVIGNGTAYVSGLGGGNGLVAISFIQPA
jgi:hypothetical protein